MPEILKFHIFVTEIGVPTEVSLRKHFIILRNRSLFWNYNTVKHQVFPIYLLKVLYVTERDKGWRD